MKEIQSLEKAIELYSCICEICGLNFEEEYGEMGGGFIEVHHKKIYMNRLKKSK